MPAHFLAPVMLGIPEAASLAPISTSVRAILVSMGALVLMGLIRTFALAFTVGRVLGVKPISMTVRTIHAKTLAHAQTWLVTTSVLVWQVTVARIVP